MEWMGLQSPAEQPCHPSKFPAVEAIALPHLTLCSWKEGGPEAPAVPFTVEEVGIQSSWAVCPRAIF